MSRLRPCSPGLVPALLVAVALLAGCASPAAATPSHSPDAASSSDPASPPALSSPSPLPPSAQQPSTSPAGPSPSTTPLSGPGRSWGFAGGRIPCPGRGGGGSSGGVTAESTWNWAGYVARAGAGRVGCVEGSWTEPDVQCDGLHAEAVGVWVGVDGNEPDGSGTLATLAQVGMRATCSIGRAGDAYHVAWYQFLPDMEFSVDFDLGAAPGDQMWARVSWSDGQFEADVVNLTQRTGRGHEWAIPSAPRSTAEWVVERGETQCGSFTCQMQLADFGTIALDGAATIDGVRYPLAALPGALVRNDIVYPGSPRRTLATTSPIGPRGFTVTWKGPA
jgi:hypothetical protein